MLRRNCVIAAVVEALVSQTPGDFGHGDSSPANVAGWGSFMPPPFVLVPSAMAASCHLALIGLFQMHRLPEVLTVGNNYAT